MAEEALGMETAASCKTFTGFLSNTYLFLQQKKEVFCLSMWFDYLAVVQLQCPCLFVWNKAEAKSKDGLVCLCDFCLLFFLWF